MLQKIKLSLLSVIGFGMLITGCTSIPKTQPLPPVKVITETVQVEIYQPPLPSQIQLADVEWKVITNRPCLPATGRETVQGGNRSYYTTERFAYETIINADGTSSRQVVRDANNNRVELPQLKDSQGKGILVCGNIDQKIAEIETMLDGDFVIFAITPVGYEKMAANLQEIKRYINQQKEIIYYYRESTAPKGRQGWLQENSQRQQNQQEVVESDAATKATEELNSSSGFNIRNLIPFSND